MGGPFLLTILATQEKRESGAFSWSMCTGNGINEIGWDNHHERLCDVWHIDISSEGWGATRLSVHLPSPHSLSIHALVVRWLSGCDSERTD